MLNPRRTQLAVLISLASTSMGLMALLPVLALYIGDRFAISDPGQLTWWTGLIYGAAPLAAAICGPVWGALGDRIGKRPMAIRANLAIALTTALMPFADTPMVLMVLRAVQGSLAGYVAPAMALVIQHTPADRQGRTIARMQVVMALGFGVGPLVGAELTLAIDMRALFWFTSAMALVSALVLWLFAREERPKPVESPHRGVALLWHDFAAVGGQLFRNRAFVVLLLLIWLLRLGQNMLEPFIALFVEELDPSVVLGAFCASEPETIAWTISCAFSIVALAQIVFTPMWGRASDRFGPLRCLALLSLVLGLVQMTLSLADSADSFLALRLLAAAFMAGSMTLAYASVSTRVQPERRTLAFSMVQSCLQLGFAFGPLVGGRIAMIGASDEQANLRLPFIAAGALCVAAGLGMLWLRWRSSGFAKSVPSLSADRL